MAVVLDQEWSMGAGGANGTATAAGAFLVAVVNVGDETATPTVSDNGSNAYTLAASHTGEESWSNIFVYYCANAAATSAITVAGGGSGTVAAGLWSFTGVDSLDVFDDDRPAAGSSFTLPVTVSESGSLAMAFAGVGNTSRTLVNSATGWSTAVERRSSGLYTVGSYNLNASAGSVGPEWTITSGSNADPSLVTVAFSPSSGSGPSELEVDAGSDQSVYVGQTAPVSAEASGGTSPYTYAWTRISGPAGSFLNANQATTMFNPTGGAGTYVLRCIATDAASQTAQDDLVLTVSQAPSLVTVASVNDSTGWTATGGTVLQVLSDTSDSTLITSQENPTAQVLDVTMGPAVMVEGQHWTQRVRMRRSSSASSGTATGYLYVGSTLISTVTGKSIPGSLGDVDFTFPNAEISGITGAQWTAGVRFVVEVTAA